MPSFEIGEMFWGKSLSYPWWPCLIVPNDKNETSRNRKKLGIQYHVQFLGSDYDVCWITDSFLIEYAGKESFASFVEAQLSSDLSTQEKVKYDMRMSSSIQLLWVQACHEAERIFRIDIKDRLNELPQPPNTSLIPLVPTKIISKRNLSKASVTESFSDQLMENDDISVKRSKRKQDNSSLYKELDDAESDYDSNEKDIGGRKQKKKITKTSISKESNYQEKSDNEDIKDVSVQPIKKKRPAKRRYYYVTDNEDDEVEPETMKSAIKSDDKTIDKSIEDRCFNSYLAKEMSNRSSDINSPMIKKTQETMLRKQWDALDMTLKLQYLNDDVSYSGESKSKVSGRKIKIPSKLRKTDDFEKLRKIAPKIRPSEPPNKKLRLKSDTPMTQLSVKTENSETITTCDSSPLSNVVMCDNAYREMINEKLWNNLTVQDCASEMMRIVVMKSLPDVGNICCHCFKTLSPSDNTVHCKGPCQSSFHLLCAIHNKIIRSEDVSICSNCSNKNEICCICHNSKYMKKQSLIKCINEDCSCYFHVPCVKFLIFIDRNLSNKDPEFCPKHSCLTCSREDYNHSCNDYGSLVSCIKCPISYHSNLVCIPAGCRIIGKNRIVCYRHFDNSFVIKKAQQLSRCFICFNDKATLKCCRCRAVFHPKCMSMATYTDLLRDYVCNTCKLEQPMFQGQVVWVETNKKWYPAEIVNPINPVLEDVHERFAKSLTVRHLESHQYCFSNRCELIPYEIGVSVLKEFIDISDPVLKLAKIRNVSYWNWRCRLRPLTSEKYTLIGQCDLLEYSSNGYKSQDQFVIKYETINENVVPEHIQKLIPPKSSENCSCKFPDSTCTDDRCFNYKNDIECCGSNCINETCKNRLFSQIPPLKPTLFLKGISNRGLKFTGTVDENCLLGEIKGALLCEEDVLKELNKREHLESVSYIFQLLGKFFINCEQKSNIWRFVNHSCEPNSKTVGKNISGSFKLGIVSMKSISDEEITIDYRKSLVLKCGFVCHCHSPSCSQIIGPTSIFDTDKRYISPLCCSKNESSKTSSPVINFSPVLTVRRMNMTPVKPLSICDNTDNAIIDDKIANKVTCYKCGNHGEFISCDRSNCKKQYHLMCIEKSKKPNGLWLCPIHFCCYCNSAATIFCDNCPISCCKKHGKLHLLHICTTNPNGDSEEDVANIKNFPKKEEYLTGDVPEKIVTRVISSVEDKGSHNECQKEGQTDQNMKETEKEFKVDEEKEVKSLMHFDKEEKVVCEEATMSLSESGLAVVPSIMADNPTVERAAEKESSEMVEEVSVEAIADSSIETEKTEEGIVISKDDLYVSCGLVPVMSDGSESPPQIRVTLPDRQLPMMLDAGENNSEILQVPVVIDKESDVSEIHQVPVIILRENTPQVPKTLHDAETSPKDTVTTQLPVIIVHGETSKVPKIHYHVETSRKDIMSTQGNVIFVHGVTKKVTMTSQKGHVTPRIPLLFYRGEISKDQITSDSSDTSEKHHLASQIPVALVRKEIPQIPVTTNVSEIVPKDLVTSDHKEISQVTEIVYCKEESMDYNEDRVHSPEGLDSDCEDVRFQVIPSKIAEMEDTIISPCILDE